MSFEIKRARGKTAVYSGSVNRESTAYSEIPSLQNLCLNKLKEHASRIEQVGDVPFYVLEPMLKDIPFIHLRRIESFNPHLADDSDSHVLWKRPCELAFAGREPRKGETWRELYKRCEREREHKIEKIAKRIKRHEDKAAPQRQTKVVENQLANGRRAIATVIKKTIKSQVPVRGGGHHSLNGSSASSSSSSNQSRPGATKTITTTTIIRRDAANGSSGSRLTKPKTAPLMQKSMQLFKSRFRR